MSCDQCHRKFRAWGTFRNTATFDNASENNNVLLISNVNDETRNNIPDEVSELSVPETRFDRQPHTHRTALNNSIF